MKKQEFLERIESEGLNIGEYIIKLDRISDAPLVLGCAYNQGVWKVYETRERGGHSIIKKIDSEEDAFDYFYKVVLSQHNRFNN
ncbi:hypothetical protein J5S49_15475 [Virgibacillus halodenitrificans]|uniref:Uncharacterized protein n=1 Tax=Virgibacillus halodenitrificans TaxID=1482 RepID=A0ABR7VJZ9_VIRHA|nr:hypothetical protein [Virgibacillus halodenitrificans]MBD1221601.1 hypothetical protein [Virgibacillus halodenitrificans]MCG1029680.1 hypothetical protein [Virgibacillus halodenitrificans]MCJ0932395.1 hypothetical protein [Virgibacillus halodenitrificans]MYL58220.1 hypothetical protein [Virgibacillus halodenitrificans]